MRKLLLGAVFGLFSATNCFAQSCNSPSGFLQSYGPSAIGDVLILGPDCNHLQDGGFNSGAGIINILAFGADPTDTRDSTTAIQNAINSCPLIGCMVLFPVGNYLISGTIHLGNGNHTTTSSTTNGINLVCAAGIRFGLTGTAGAPAIGPCNIDANLNNSVFQIDGPIVGWGISGISVTFRSPGTSTQGLVTFSASYGTVEKFMVNNIGGFGILHSVVSGGPTGEFNTWRDITTWLSPSSANATAIQISSGSSTNGLFGDSWDNINIIPGASTQIGLHIGLADSMVFNRLTVEPLSGFTSILFDYSSNNSFPSAIGFINPDIGTGGSYTNNGTPAASIGPNYIIGLNTTNNGTIPNLANLAVLAPNRLILSPGGNTTNGQIAIDANGHPGFKGTTPTFGAGGGTCGGTGAAISGNDNGGVVNSGTTAETTCSIVFSHAYSSDPTCQVMPLSAATWASAPSVSTTGITVTWTASAAGFFWNYNCSSIN